MKKQMLPSAQSQTLLKILEQSDPFFVKGMTELEAMLYYTLRNLEYFEVLYYVDFAECRRKLSRFGRILHAVIPSRKLRISELNHYQMILQDHFHQHGIKDTKFIQECFAP